jgi:hypothetical protein
MNYEEKYIFLGGLSLGMIIGTWLTVALYYVLNAVG